MAAIKTPPASTPADSLHRRAAETAVKVERESGMKELGFEIAVVFTAIVQSCKDTNA